MQINLYRKCLVFGLIVVIILMSILSSAIRVISYETTLNASDDNTTAGIASTTPVVTTNETTDLTNISAKLWGYLFDDGGENCSIWFEWDDYDLETECAGLIATGTAVKDGRSIFINYN